MVKRKDTVLSGEIVFALLILVIFLSLLITWTVVSNAEEASTSTSSNDHLYGDNSGAEINIEVVPEMNGGEGVT